MSVHDRGVFPDISTHGGGALLCKHGTVSPRDCPLLARRGVADMSLPQLTRNNWE